MTSLTDLEIVEQHALEAAFLWSARDAATGDPIYDLADLAVVDERLEAHFEGLRAHGDAGWDAARAALDDGDAGEAYVMARLAIERGDLLGVARVLDAAERAPTLRKGVAAALGWARSTRSAPCFQRSSTATARSGCNASASRRAPRAAWIQGQRSAFALHGDDAPLLDRALRAAGELGGPISRPEIRAALDSEHEACRFAAAWAGALLGEPASAPVLWALAGAGGPFAERAVAMAARRAPAEAPARIAAIERVNGGLRAAIAATAALGDPAQVPG